MSTLLKKKYCKEHDASSAGTDSVSADAAVLNTKPCYIPTVTDEDNSLDEVSDPPSKKRVKSVRFDMTRIVTINAATVKQDTEKLLQYREDIWYTVSSWPNVDAKAILYLTNCAFVVDPARRLSQLLE
jgi:hypothetical protein